MMYASFHEYKSISGRHIILSRPSRHCSTIAGSQYGRLSAPACFIDCAVHSVLTLPLSQTANYPFMSSSLQISSTRHFLTPLPLISSQLWAGKYSSLMSKHQRDALYKLCRVHCIPLYLCRCQNDRYQINLQVKIHVFPNFAAVIYWVVALLVLRNFEAISNTVNIPWGRSCHPKLPNAWENDRQFHKSLRKCSNIKIEIIMISQYGARREGDSMYRSIVLSLKVKLNV